MARVVLSKVHFPVTASSRIPVQLGTTVLPMMVPLWANNSLHAATVCETAKSKPTWQTVSVSLGWSLLPEDNKTTCMNS